MTAPHTAHAAEPSADLTAFVQALPGLLRRLEDLSRRQRALIDADEGEALLELLGQRASVIEHLSQHLRELERERAAWGAGPRSPAQARIQTAIDEATAVAAAVAERDRADHAALRARRDALGRQLGEIGISRRAASAYAPAAQRGPRFQDQEG